MQASIGVFPPVRKGASPRPARPWLGVIAMLVSMSAYAKDFDNRMANINYPAYLPVLSQQVPQVGDHSIQGATFPSGRWKTPADLSGETVAARPQSCSFPSHIPSFCEQYSKQLIAFAAIFVVILAFALSLQGQRFRRLYTEEDAPQKQTSLGGVTKLKHVSETASIVHEINQPLGAILANADAATMMLTNRTSQDQELMAILKDIRNDSLRASQIIQKLRALLSKRSLKSIPLSLNDVVATSMVQLENLARRHETALRLQLTEDLPAIMGDNTHLQQVLFNLAANGMESMSELLPAQRVLRISTSRDYDGHIVVAVSDRGQGIPPDVLPYIFESFYTTKPEGMGMGLAIVRSIVEAHHGRIEAENIPGGGAILKVILNAAEPVDSAKTMAGSNR